MSCNIKKRIRHNFKPAPIEVSLLPKSLREVAEVIGTREAAKIANHIVLEEAEYFKVYFQPKRANSNKLKGVVSDESVSKLCDTFANMEVTFPACKKWKRGDDKRNIRVLSALGMPTKKIAIETGVHLVTVYRELARKSH